MSSKTHYRWKEDLVGEVSPFCQLTTKKSSVIDEEELRQPLEWSEAVCRCVCEQCGHIGEIDLFYAQRLLKIMSLMGDQPEIPLKTRGDFRKYYFLTSYCERCFVKEVTIALKEIK